MKGDNPARHFVLAFVIAVALYAVSYTWIEHRRYRKGPWEITFINSAGGPAMVINQGWLGLTNVTLRFEGQSVPATNSAAIATLPEGSKIEFRNPRPVPFNVPFGNCIFEDLTFLPGTVTLQVFGHDIEMLPRVLVIDLKETQWKSGAVIKIQNGNAQISKAD